MSFTGGGMGRRGGCKTKSAYGSKSHAEAAADWMADHLGAYREGMHVYRCPFKACRQWHVAKNLTKDRRGRRWATTR